MDLLRVSTFSLLILHLVTEVYSCTEPTTCVRADDSCREVQKFVSCRDDQSRDCSEAVRTRHEVSIKLIKSTYSKSPFNCVFSKGSSNFRCGFVAIFLATVLSKVLNNFL
ncbi:uncharacterized protein LOC135464830 isoform X2 [Liolophura sinensis]